MQWLELPTNRANSSWCPSKRSPWESGSFSPDRTVLVSSSRNSTGKESSVSNLLFSPCIDRPQEQMPLSQSREQNSLSHKLSPGSAGTHLKINILSATLHLALLCFCKHKWQSLISYANGTWHFKYSDTEAVNKKPVTADTRVCSVPTITADMGGSWEHSGRIKPPVHQKTNYQHQLLLSFPASTQNPNYVNVRGKKTNLSAGF